MIKKMSISSILKHYQKNKCTYWRNVLDYYAKLPNLKTVIEEAGQFHKDAQHCDNHQCRIYKKSKKQFLFDLRKIKSKISKCQNFYELYNAIKQYCSKDGIGELAIYDTTMRIGAFLEKAKAKSFKPNMIHLHNGTMKGSKELLNKRLIIGPLAPMASLSVFSKIFPNLSAWEIEEILCIYKVNF